MVCLYVRHKEYRHTEREREGGSGNTEGYSVE